MNSLVIPPPPNWYESAILACAPDNTLIYGSRNDIVVIEDAPNDQPANVRIIPRAHSQKIICTGINKNWGQPNKLLVTVAEDKIIKLWNIDLMERKLAHHEHASHGKVIGATFAGDEKIISISEEGVIIIWNISVNQTNTIRDLFGFKVTVTCISTCPHATWLTAFGLKSGLVVITDLRKEGKVLYKLRGHDKSVLSLAWCPAPINIFPKDPNNYVGTKEKNIHRSKQSKNESDTSKTTNSKSVLSENKEETGSKQIFNKKNLWTDLKHADDDDIIQDSIKQDETHPLLKVYDDDFLKECQTLKDRILGTSSSHTGVLAVEKEGSKEKKDCDDYELESKEQETPDEKTDVTKEREEIRAKSEMHEEEVISLCKYKDNLEKYAIAEGKKVLPDVLADVDVTEKALTEIKSEDTDKIIKKEAIEDVEVNPSDVSVPVSVVKDEGDVVNDENIKEIKQELPIVAPTVSTYVSACIQDRNMKEVSSPEDKIDKFIIPLKEELSGGIKQELPIVAPTVSTSGSACTQDRNVKEVSSPEDKIGASQDGIDKCIMPLKEELSGGIKQELPIMAPTLSTSGSACIQDRNMKEVSSPEDKIGASQDGIDKCIMPLKEELSGGIKQELPIMAPTLSTSGSACIQDRNMKEVSSPEDKIEASQDGIDRCIIPLKDELSGGIKQELPYMAPTVSTTGSACIQDRNMKQVSSPEDKIEASQDGIDTSIMPLIESTCDTEGKSDIVEEPLTGDDSGTLPDESKEITPIKSENESDGADGKSFTEEVSSTLIASTVAVAEDESDNKENVTADDSKEGDGEVCEEVGRISIDEEPRKEFLLASSGREGHIYIWRAGTDGRMQTFLSLPNKSTHRKFGRTTPDKVWIVLSWVTPNILLSSSKSAELIRWNLPKPRDTSKQSVMIHNDHNSLLFSIAAPIIRLDKSNWLDKVVNGKERRLIAWTVGHDRLLLCTSFEKERKNLACYPTVGRAECFAASPIDSNRLAIGTGEGVIRLWDVSRPHIKNIIMTNFYQKIQGKVVTLAWHPHNEMVLAYGTSEGRIGYMDTSKKKPPTLLPNFFKSQIHKIEWGPMKGNIQDIGLFVVAEGKLVVFDTKTHQKEPQEVDTPDNTYVYSFAWKPNYEVLLVTTKAGAVITYSMDLKIMSTQYLQHKLQNIYWHSTATSSDLKMSKYCYYFAAISNFKELIVYNSAIKTDISEERVVSKYKGSGDVINCAAWNPHSQPELVIAREDGVAQVWNVDTNTVESTYINPLFESLSTVIWSPLEAQFVITASRDHTIKVWNKSDFPTKSEQEISDLRKAVIKKMSNEASHLLPKVEQAQEEPVKVKKPSKTNLLPNFNPMKNTSQLISDLRKLLLWKEGESRAVLDEDQDEPNILNIFDSNEHMLKLIELNESAHKQKGKYHLDTTLSLFKGDISTAIKAAVDEKRVTPWVIMMAPMVSHKLWHAACEVYAQQLSVEADSDPLEIATLYLMCHKVEEAIKTLCEGALYREALALAKCRLASDDPTITNVIEQWGRNSLIVGNFEMAAQCDIVLGRYASAASVLFRRSDVETLKFAVELAEKSGNEELHQAVLFRYNAFAAEENKISENEKELPTKAEAILQKEQGEGADKKVELLQKSDGDKVVESFKQEVKDGEQKIVPTKTETTLQKEQAEDDEKVRLRQKSDDEEVESHKSQKEQVEDAEKVGLLRKSDRDEVESHEPQKVNGSVPTKAETVLQKEQTEDDEKVRPLQKFDDEKVDSHKSQKVSGSEQKSVPIKVEAISQEQVEDDKKVGLLRKSDGDEVESHEPQEVNGSVPTKAETVLQKEQTEDDEKVRPLQKFNDEKVDKSQKVSGSEQKSVPIKVETISQEQVEDDKKVGLLRKSDGDEVESHEPQEVNGSVPTKAETVLQKEQTEDDEKVRPLQKFNDEKVDKSQKVSGSEQKSVPIKVETISQEQVEDDKKVGLLRKSDGDEVESHEPQEVNGSVPTKAETVLQKEQTEDDEKVRPLQKFNDEKVDKSQKVSGSEQKSVPIKVETISQEQVEDDKKVGLLRKSDGDEVESHEPQEVSGSVPVKAETILQKEQATEVEQVLLRKSGGEGVESNVNDSEQNSVDDLNSEKKPFSDESSGKIEEPKEMVLSDVNIESLASAAKPSEEKCSGSTVAVRKQNEGLLTTEEVKKLLSNSKLEFLNDSDLESADLNKNSKDKCY